MRAAAVAGAGRRWPAPRRAAAAPVAPLFIRDVRPTTLEPGDTAGDRVPGHHPWPAAEVRIQGRPARRALAAAVPGRRPGRGAGDRVVLDIDQPPMPMRLHAVQVEVTQGDRAWRLRPGHTLELSFAPASLQGHRPPAGRAGGAASAPALQRWLPYLLVAALALVIHLLVAPLTGLVVVWERKIWGRMQSRIGPNRVGPARLAAVAGRRDQDDPEGGHRPRPRPTRRCSASPPT